MDITAFVNDVIIGTAEFFRDMLNTAVTVWATPLDLLPLLADGAATPPGIVPPVTYFVVSVIALVLAALATGSLLTPSTRSFWLLAYLKETVRTLAWKRLFLFAVPFLALFTILAWSISLIAGWIGTPVEYAAALALCCYFGGTSYLWTSVLLVLALPQWANDPDRRFRPYWLWGTVLGLLAIAGFWRSMHAFMLLLDRLVGGAWYEMLLIYGLGLALATGVLGLVVLWAKPFIDRTNAHLQDD